MTFRLLFRVTAAAVLAVATLSATAQAYPEKPVKLIVPVPPGGGGDIAARLMVEPLRARLGQPVIIDNKGGAGTLIGTDMAARGAADGYTLLLNTDQIALLPLLYAKLGFDPVRDFIPVSFFAGAPIVLVARPGLPANSISELVALARKDPGSVKLATSGPGTPHDLAVVLFARKAGAQFTVVPYKGNGPVLTDLLGGHVDIGMMTLSSVQEQAKSGKVKILAVLSDKRTVLAPDIRTMAEAGLPGVEVSVRYALFAPAGTAAPIITRLQDAMAQIASNPAYQADMLRHGFEALSSTSQETIKVVASERDRWAPLIKAAGTTPQ